MNNQHAHRATPRCLLVLVGPAAVVGQRLALEKALVLRRRLIHNHQRHFALQVHSRVVVPLVLRRVDAVAHKHNRRINLRHLLPGLVLGDNLRGIRQIHGRSAGRSESKLRLLLHGVHRIQRHSLEPASLVARRLQPRQRELRGNILGRQLVSARAGAAPFQQIKRQKPHMRADLRPVNRLRRRARRHRQTRHGRYLRSQRCGTTSEQ